MKTSGQTAAGHRKRLRERFKKASLEGFHDYEVVELLLTYAIPRQDVKPAAKALIKRFGGLKGVFDARLDELTGVKGVGEHAAFLLAMLKGAAAGYLKESGSEKLKIFSPKDVVRSLSNGPAVPKGEHLCAVYLNSKNEVLGVEVLHEGRLNEATVSARGAIEKAFEHNARSVIFVHCLSDGKLRAAEMGMAERGLVQGLQEAASALDIIVHDYIVLGNGTLFSAREAGVLKKD